MIYLETEPYCDDCPSFDPEAEHSETLCHINGKPLIRLTGKTVVQCKHRYQCNHIKRYLENYLENGSKKENT